MGKKRLSRKKKRGRPRKKKLQKPSWRDKYSDEELKNIVKEMEDGLGFRAASRKYCIPLASLDRLKKNGGVKHQLGRKTKLARKLETDLEQFIKLKAIKSDTMSSHRVMAAATLKNLIYVDFG